MSIELLAPFQTFNLPFVYMQFCLGGQFKIVWSPSSPWSLLSALLKPISSPTPIIHTSSFDSPPIQAQFWVKHGLLPPTLLNYIVLSCIVLYCIINSSQDSKFDAKNTHCLCLHKEQLGILYATLYLRSDLSITVNGVKWRKWLTMASLEDKG